MSIELRVVLLFAATFSIGWIITRIRKAKVRLEDTFFWMVMSVVLLLLGLFPGVSYWLSSILGVISPANLVFFIMICLLFDHVHHAFPNAGQVCDYGCRNGTAMQRTGAADRRAEKKS